MAKCMICFSQIQTENGCMTHCCNTTYCKKCLTPWLQIHHSCPQCRKDLADIAETMPMNRILARLNIPTEPAPSENDIREFIENAAKSHRNITDFKNDFEESLNRVPSFKEINLFIKLQGQSQVPKTPEKSSYGPLKKKMSEGKAQSIPIRFISDSKSRGVFSVTGVGMKTCVWKREDRDWAVLDTEMQTGVYSLIGKMNDRSTWFGVLSKQSLFTQHRDQRLFKAPGQCCFGYFGNSDYIIGGDNTILCEAERGSFFPPSGKARVGLELNLDKGVLFFFVDGKQLPHCVANIPSGTGMYFAMDAKFAGSSFTVTSFTKLSAPTVSDTDGARCTVYEWE